jgi:hypothetical protein
LRVVITKPGSIILLKWHISQLKWHIYDNNMWLLKRTYTDRRGKCSHWDLPAEMIAAHCGSAFFGSPTLSQDVEPYTSSKLCRRSHC